MIKRVLLAEFAVFLMVTQAAGAADLPIKEVILYKHGVGYFERSGELKPGETAKLDFKAADMNDVLKSLTIVDRNGGSIGGVRYDASETLEKRLEDYPFAVGGQASLAAFLDQMKGARLELRLGPDTIAGSIVSGRVTAGNDRTAEKETVVLLTDSGEIRVFDLGAASSVKLSDPKLQSLLKDYLNVLSGARSKDRRSVYIDAGGNGTKQIAASYMTPSAVWKSSYRLIFPTTGQPTLEGWAIVDNTSGDDWTNVKLSVVSGRPISFITQLYEPRYVQRPTAELAENRAVAPVVFNGALDSVATFSTATARAQAAAPAAAGGRGGGRGAAPAGGVTGALAQQEAVSKLKSENGDFASSIVGGADTRDLGELFEYSFANPVTVKQGESTMLPFLQQKVGARKLIIYMESFGQHPMNATEITNSTGKTLDGGPITVYDANAYAGEALVETLKAGDKRLISYGVDLGTRITTKFDSSTANVQQIHYKRGILTSTSSIQETRTFTINNVDPQRKTVVIEFPQRNGYKLLPGMKPSETTVNAYRFEVNVGANATETFAIHEERVYDQTISVNNMTSEGVSTWLRNVALSANGRQQLQQIAAKKKDIADVAAQIQQIETDRNNTNQDQDRLRRNIESLRQVAGQQDIVQQYARQLADSEVKLAAMRDQSSALQKKQSGQTDELNSLIEKAEF